MEGKRWKVLISGEEYEYPEGTKYLQIAEDFQEQYEHKIVLAMVNGHRLQELNRVLKSNIELSFLTVADDIGYKAYTRSLSFLLVKAMHDVGGHDKVDRVRIHFSLGTGYYCTLEGNVQLTQELLEKVEERMHQLCDEKILIEKRAVPTAEAIELFHGHGMYDKERLFEYRRSSEVNIYKINEFEDYYYGYMVPDTSYLRYFALKLYDGGFILQMPSRKNPEKVEPVKFLPKLFNVLNDSVNWGDIQGIDTVGALNDMITYNDMREVVLVQEAYQESKIAEIAKQIVEQKNVKFVLIAGPSSSGKTTFSHRLSIQLRVQGMVPHPIAVDNYFVNREDTPKHPDGSYNFECLEAIDVELFNKDMKALLSGEEVYLPVFDFKEGQRRTSTIPKKLGEHDILVIEGIHCLNPKLTESLNDENKFKIYISALTQLNVDEHNRIPTTDGRLVRRIVRDARTRGTSARGTIAMWDSVRNGEEKNIFPYQEEADVMFNSSMLYELAVLKQFVEPLLFGVDKKSPEYAEAKRLLKFFDYFVGIDTKYVPTNSILREFIGGGCFDV